MLVAILLVGLVLWLSNAFSDDDDEKAAEARSQRQSAEAREQEEAAKAQQARLDKAAQESREKAEAEAKRIVEQAIGIAAKLDQVDLSKGWDAVDNALREAHFTRLVRGKHLTAKCLASPTGRIAIEWIVADDKFKSYILNLKRDDKLIMQDCGEANRWAGQLRRGTRCMFEISLRDRHGYLLESAQFEIHTPSLDEWNETVEPMPELVVPAPPPPPAPEPEPDDPTTPFEREITASLVQATVVRKVRDEHYAAIDQIDGLDEQQKEDAKADVDSAIARVRDRYED